MFICVSIFWLDRKETGLALTNAIDYIYTSLCAERVPVEEAFGDTLYKYDVMFVLHILYLVFEIIMPLSYQIIEVVLGMEVVSSRRAACTAQGTL